MIIIIALLLSWNLAQIAMAEAPYEWPKWPSCGQLSQESYANFTHIADINEYPWIARLGSQTSSGFVDECLGVLITNRDLLTFAHCFNDDLKEPVSYALLGDSKPSDSKLLEIAEVAVHPNYDSRRLINDIAVLRLSQPVSSSSHISPVCMPPPTSVDNYAYLGQHLPYAGFALNTSVVQKQKALVQVLGVQRCRFALIGYGSEAPAQYLCGSSNAPQPLNTGAPLMGVQVERGEPQSFYLIGLLLRGPVTAASKSPLLFLRVDQHRAWIEQNVL